MAIINCFFSLQITQHDFSAPLTRRSPHFKAMFLALGFNTALATSLVMAQEIANKIVSAQVRKQGHKCDEPATAVRDTENSKPHVAVWILTCANAKYRVQLTPGLASNIEELSD